MKLTGLQDSLILLFATAGISGFLVPFILNRVQVRNQQRQKQLEADLARQAKVIEEQVALLERLAAELWSFQLMLIAPLYYGQEAFFNMQTIGPETYQEAARKYLSGASIILGSIRTEIGKAVRLVPQETWQNLRKLYYDELLPLDLKVTKLLSSGPAAADRKSWHETQIYALEKLADIFDATVDDLAEKLQLKYHEDARPGSPTVRRRISRS